MKIHYTENSKEWTETYTKCTRIDTLTHFHFGFSLLLLVFLCLRRVNVRERVKYNRTDVFFTTNEIYCTSWRNEET